MASWYALTTQMESAAEIPSWAPMVGSATFAMEPSMTERDTPKATARMAPSRRGIGIPSVGPAMWGVAYIFSYPTVGSASTNL